MAKEDFYIGSISKKQAGMILIPYHYLTGISKGFKSYFNYGLWRGTELCGACIFTPFPTPEVCVGMFGIARNDQDGLFELSRLALRPDIQSQEYNITSWFMSRAIRQLQKDTSVRAILSYADTEYHKGVIYRACNFKYYGTNKVFKDLYIEHTPELGLFDTEASTVLIKKSRGKKKDQGGCMERAILKTSFFNSV